MAELMLDRAEAMNAINTAMAVRLAQACAELAKDPHVQAVVLYGTGARAFWINHRRHAARLRSSTEFTDRLSRLDSVVAVNQRVPTATQVVGDAGDPARELAL